MRREDPKFAMFYRDYNGETGGDNNKPSEEKLEAGRVRRRIEDILEASRLEDEWTNPWE